MSRAERGLLTNEAIIYSTKVHWNIFIIPALLILLVSVPAMYEFFTLHFRNKNFLIALAILPVILILISHLNRTASEFVVTNMRVVIYLGLLSSRSFEIMLNKIESIVVDQALTGKLLNFGSLVVGGTGGTKERFSNIQNPFEFRRRVEEEMSKITH
jgi:uncharacterized membrane protein YdbT with pleckstrin-like domain